MPITIVVQLYENSDQRKYATALETAYKLQYSNHLSTYYIPEPIDVSELSADPIQPNESDNAYKTLTEQLLTSIHNEINAHRLTDTHQFHFAFYYDGNPKTYAKVKNFLQTLIETADYYNYQWTYFQFLFFKSTPALKNELSEYAADQSLNRAAVYTILLGVNPYTDNLKSLCESSAIFMFTASNTDYGVDTMLSFDVLNNIDQYFISLSSVTYEQLNGEQIKNEIKDIKFAKSVTDPANMITAACSKDFENFFSLILRQWRYNCDYIPVPIEALKPGANNMLVSDFSNMQFENYFNLFEAFCRETIASYAANLQTNSELFKELLQWKQQLQLLIQQFDPNNKQAPSLTPNAVNYPSTLLRGEQTVKGILQYLTQKQSVPAVTTIFPATILSSIQRELRISADPNIYQRLETLFSNNGNGNIIINDSRIKDALLAAFTSAYHKQLLEAAQDIDAEQVMHCLDEMLIAKDYQMRIFENYPTLQKFNDSAIEKVTAARNIPHQLHTKPEFLLFVSQEIENEWADKYEKQLGLILSQTHNHHNVNPLLSGNSCTLFCVDSHLKTDFYTPDAAEQSEAAAAETN